MHVVLLLKYVYIGVNEALAVSDKKTQVSSMNFSSKSGCFGSKRRNAKFTVSAALEIQQMDRISLNWPASCSLEGHLHQKS